MSEMFQNKTVIVLDAGDMPCSEIVVELARQGARVILIGRDLDNLAAVQKLMKEIGGQAYAYECDMNNSSEVARLATKMKDLFGCCDYLINGSGGELVKLFPASARMKIYAKNSYFASWIEKRTNLYQSAK